MTTIKTVTVVQSRPCGFCATETHEHCPSGIIGMGDTKVWQCGCGCSRSRQIKCFTCNAREDAGFVSPEIDPTTWRCFDLDACLARVEARLAANPTIQQIRARTQDDDPERPVRIRTSQPRQTAGQCLHCGEPTKGGKFLPGHDAAYLSALQKQVVAGDLTVEAAKGKLVEDNVSPALQAKFEKRVSK